MQAKPPVLAKVNSDADHAFPSGRFFWALCFAYASFMALLLQKLILPLWPEMHAGHGLMMNDAIVFHDIAVTIANRINTLGWSEWRMFPPGSSGNVGLLSAIYALLGPDPAWFIPFNAAAHATGALLIYKIGQQLAPGNVGKLGGLIAATCFLVFPSALQWYGQNHKDAFAIAGILLVLDAWLALQSPDRISIRLRTLFLLQVLTGTTLLGVVRPYYITVLSLGLAASLTIPIFVDLLRRKRPSGQTTNLIVLLILVASMGIVFAKYGNTLTVGMFAEFSQSKEMTSGEMTSVSDWQVSPFLPGSIDKAFQRASELRKHFVIFGRSVGAGSEIDGDRLPNTAAGALAYMPRALFVGLFAPFPNTWGDRMTAPRLIGAMETAVWYLFLLGAVITVTRLRSRKLLAGAVFCAALITMLAYIHPNVGTLYRQRFGMWHFFLLIGAVGWSSIVLGYMQRRSANQSVGATSPITAEEMNQETIPITRTDRMLASGAIVIAITLVCYLGFFVRDLLLIGQLGMGDELDAFFAAAMIPMFFVACLTMPLGDALVIPFISLRDAPSRQLLLRHVMGFALLLLGLTSTGVAGGAPYLAHWVLGETTPEKLATTIAILRWFALIITLSAWTALGNAALNAIGMQRNAALGQLVVPVSTVVALAVAPAGTAVIAGISGMLVGTAANAIWVLALLRWSNFQLLPVLPSRSVLRPVLTLYRPLFAAAFFPAILVPLNYAFAASVSSGTVSAWAFASKIVVLFSGLASVGATAVLLPHLAHTLRMFGKGEAADAKLMLALGVWGGGILMLAGFLFAEPLVATAMSRNITSTQVVDLANIVKVGMLQLPMAISYALVTKMAIASGSSSRVMYAAILGFIGNILVNVLLVPKLGVMGVALGALVATTLSTLVTLLTSYRDIGLKLNEIVVVLASWLAWVSVCIALASTSVAAIVSASIALFALGRTQMNLLRDDSLARTHLAS